MSRFAVLLILLLPISLIGQTVKGKLYDNKTTAKNVRIVNTIKNVQVYSNDTGDFQISASIGDTIAFRSIFYKEHTLVVKQEHINDIIVVQLKKVVNELDEVLLAEKPKFKPYDQEKFQANFETQLAEDMKNRPYLYNSYRSGGLDFVAIAKAIGRVFKKKRPEPEQYMTYKELDSFFKNNDYFNKKLLNEELGIPDDQRFLFFDYCEVRLISKKTISGNRFELLDKLMNYSRDFLELLKESNSSKKQ